MTDAYSSSLNNPEILIKLGEKYKITNNASGHPFKISNSEGDITTLYHNSTYEFTATTSFVNGLNYICIYHPGMSNTFSIQY